MNTWKKLGAVLLASVLLLSGCAKAPASQSGTGSYKAGSYTAEAQGMNGAVKVTVTVDQDKIVSVTVDEHNETPGISDGAIEKLPQMIVDQQSLALDAVSGATFTSKAILEAAEKALTEAGGDLEALKASTEKEIAEGETETTDIVIVGAGISGIMASYELTLNHPEIKFILVEKLPTVGGSLAATGGAIFGTDSSIHQADGVKSTIDQIVNFFEQTSGSKPANEQLVRNVYESSADTLNVLENLNAPYTGKTEKVDPSNDELFSLRMENKGKGFYDFIKAEVEDKMPFDLRLETTVTELIVENGEVQGVKVEDQNKRYTIEASQVILATGGFGSNPELMQKLAPNYADGVIATNAGATGDGILLTEQFGTQVFGDGTMGSVVNPDRSDLLASTFMVSKAGVRFTNEKAPKYVIQRAVADLPEHQAFVIADSTYADAEGLQKALDSNMAVAYDTLDDLAAAAGMDAEALKAEVAAYNKAIDDQVSPGFGLKADQANKIETAPFYLETAVVRTFGTIPGIEVNDKAQVLNGEGQPVSGLFASGELIAANAFDSRYPGVGIGISFAANSGRLAAAQAASLIQK